MKHFTKWPKADKNFARAVAMWRFALHKSARRYLEHDPEKGEPISRLREALRHASAGEGRPEKIMLQEEVGV